MTGVVIHFPVFRQSSERRKVIAAGKVNPSDEERRRANERFRELYERGDFRSVE